MSELTVPLVITDNDENIIEIVTIDNDDLNHLKNDLLKLPNVDNVFYSFQIRTYYSPANDTVLMGIDFNNNSIGDFKREFSDHSYNAYPSKEYKNFNDEYDFEVIVGYNLANTIAKNDHNVSATKILETIGEIIKISINGKSYKVKISGIIHTDIPFIRGYSIITDIEVIEKMNLPLPTINMIGITTNDPLKSNLLKNDVEDLLKQFNENLTVYDWREDNPVIVNLVYVERISLLLIQVLTSFAISVGILNVLFIGVKEKLPQIGILKALGIKKSKTVLIFIIQAFFIAFFSIIIGIILGFELTILFQKIFKGSDGIPLIMMNKNIINSFSLITFISLFGFSILGSILPILFVHRMKIIDVIKAE